MTTWQKLADELKTDPALAKLEEAQVKAIIDVLMLTMHSDETVAFMEEAELEHLLHELPWIQDKQDVIDAHIEASVKKIKAIEGEEGYRTFVNECAELLPDAEVKEKTYQMVVALAGADMEVHPKERKVLDWLAASLGIPENKRAVLG